MIDIESLTWSMGIALQYGVVMASISELRRQSLITEIRIPVYCVCNPFDEELPKDIKETPIFVYMRGVINQKI